MYVTSGLLPVDSLSPGTSLLCTGPPLVGKQAFGYRFLAAGLDAGEGAILVTTTDGAAAARESVRARTVGSAADASASLHVVDAATAGAVDSDSTTPTHTVTSPADLTGMSIALGESFEALSSQGVAGIRVVVDSATTLLVYNDDERVYRFLHDVVGRVQHANAVCSVALDPDASGATAQLRGLFDGAVEFREADGRSELRLRGGTADDAGWRPFPADGADGDSVAEPGDSAPADSTAGVGGGAPAGGDTGDSRGRTATSASASDADSALDPTSLHAVIETVTAGRQTLTLCNYTGTDESLAALESTFNRLNVAVRTVALPVETPTNLAVLHRGETPVAMAPAESLVRAVGFAAEGQPFGRGERPELLALADDGVYSVENGGKRRLVGISRTIEERASRVGSGVLHTGFQSIRRLDDELGTSRMYDALAATDVEVHLYGADVDAVAALSTPAPDGFTVHTADTDELARSWFVVFDADDAEQSVTLLTEERDAERYYGFWTHDVATTDAVAGYLEQTYL